MGQIDVLVNNAGITRDGLFMRMKDEDWDEVLAGQSDLCVPPVARLPSGHDEAPLWPNSLHHLDRRRHRQSRAGQLRGLKGGYDRHVEIARRRRWPAAASQ